MMNNVEINNLELENRYKRLLSLYGTDEGFFVLALHSWVEVYIDENYPHCRVEYRFPEKLELFKESLKKSISDYSQLKAIVKIQKEHDLTNKVRHQFKQLSKEEVRASIFNFLEFLKVAKVPYSRTWEDFKRLLHIWEERITIPEALREITELRYTYQTSQEEKKKLLEKMDRYKEIERSFNVLSMQIAQVTQELEAAKQLSHAKDEKIDNLRTQLNKLKHDRSAIQKQKDDYTDLRKYIEGLQRLSSYTRSRMDFERSIIRFTPEQKIALAKIKNKGPYLIKGAAGTGKTLVLLEALKKLKQESPDKSFVLLTYTRTLVKYNRYLAHLLKEEELKDVIDTVDSFFIKMLKGYKSSVKIELELVRRLSKNFNSTDFFTDEQLALEIENFIFANQVTEEEYVQQKVSRRGLGVPLLRKQRVKVWGIVEEMKQWMNTYHTYSKNYSRLVLLHNMDQIEQKDYILVDETQDLSATELRILNHLAKEGLIMAGDEEQTIYGFYSPYQRAGIEIKGRSTTLKINFRNTIPSLELAERYKNKGSNCTTFMYAFREGPSPELFVDSLENLQKQLCRKVDILLNYIGYDPENLLILSPTQKDLQELDDLLGREGYHCTNVRDDSFDFQEAGKIRLSTLHSCKGLDSPVVLLFLSSPLPSSYYDVHTILTLQCNLLYVALTRAMDQVNVFIREDLTETAVKELIDAF
jgi:acetolactate synthase regulatory subunit